METREAVCVLCPLGCPIGFNVSRLATGPEFPARLCARGIYGPELLRHDQRIASPHVRSNGLLQETSWDAAIEQVVTGISAVVDASGPDSVAIVTGPERSTQELEAAAKLADVIGTSSVACAFEPQDWPLVTTVESAPLSAIEEAGCVLVIGDAFSTHPVVARTIIDAKFTARGNSLFVLDPRRSNTAWYASTHIQNRPGSEALFLAALIASLKPVDELANEVSWLAGVEPAELEAAAGLEHGLVARVARAFASAEKSAIVLAPPCRGVADVKLTATLADLAVKCAGEGKRLVALPSGGNVSGAAGVAQDRSWMTMAELHQGLVSGRYRALVSVGTDVAAAYPSSALSKALDEMPFVASMTMFLGATESCADAVLAAASWLEESGEVRLFDGSTSSWNAVAAPSWAALPVSEIVERISAAVPAAAARKAATGSHPSSPSLAERLEHVRKSVSAGADGLSLVTLGASGHTGSGDITRWVQWAQDMFPGGYIEVSEDFARDNGIVNGERVSVSGASGAVELGARVTDRLERGVAAVPSYDPAARALFDWSAAGDGWFETGPGHVTVRRLQS